MSKAAEDNVIEVTEADLKDDQKEELGTYTELLMEQIRNSQEMKAYDDSQQQYSEMEESTSFMDLLTRNYRSEEIRLPDELLRNPMDDDNEQVEITMISLPSDDDLTNIEAAKETSLENSVLSNLNEGSSNSEDTNWREELFLNMDVEQVQQLENGEEHINAQREGAKNKEIIEEEANESQELTEEHVDEFLRNEQLAASEGNNADIDSKYTPQIVHRNCFFHIKYKCYNKNGVQFAKKKGLVQEFEDIVNNSLTKQEFEFLWQKMIKDYGLQDNKYFNKIWEDRANFIPVWFKDNLYPFLQSTGRSEGSNARLKENLGPTYSIISFLKEFQRMVDATNIREDVEDKHSKEKRPKQLMFKDRSSFMWVSTGVDNDEGQSNAANLDGITELNNPQVKQKGRPALPKRLKSLIEEIKQKIIKQENKKIAKAKRSPKSNSKKKMKTMKVKESNEEAVSA
nr:uncharacterized protein LOC117835539 [Setaria viridis]